MCKSTTARGPKIFGSSFRVSNATFPSVYYHFFGFFSFLLQNSHQPCHSGGAFYSDCTVKPAASADWKFCRFIVISEQLWYPCALALFPLENGNEEKYGKAIVAADVLF